MPEEKIAGIIREFAKATDTGDMEKTFSLFTEDAVWVDPSGTYKGKENIKSHFAAMSRNMKDAKSVESGNGIIVQGDKAFLEFSASSMVRGKKFDMPAMCAFEFSGDKIKAIRTIYDRLLIAQQVASGWPARPMINMIVRQMEKAMK